MGTIRRKIKRSFSAPVSVELAKLWPSRRRISKMKKLNKIQMSVEQLVAIAAVIREKAPCKLLVFGLGNDSVFWSGLNRGGVSVFLEDDEDWFHDIVGRSRSLTAFLVEYDTRRTDWKRLLETPSSLEMPLPGDVAKEEWDIVLVDAPGGWKDEMPGRMKSIFLSSRLVKDSGDVFVHDCDREIEDAYCTRFLDRRNLKLEIEAPVGCLRHYRMENRSG
jgi:glucuronoxylan 4-O-methyltransferase